MRMRPLGALAAFICAATMTPLRAQDGAGTGAAAQSASRPPYTADTALRRSQGTDPSQNAALGYWMAFAQMKELPSAASAKDTDALLDANAAALATLERATRLQWCDWGIDYALGPNAPVTYLAKARALARVNSAAAGRSMRRGQPDDAVAKWLAGMRFAQHVESGGTLISTLSAWAALRDTWSGIEPWTTDKRLSPGQRTRLAAAIGALPDTVFKWDSAVLNEARVLETAARERTGSGSAAPPTEAETKRFLREIERVAAALEGSPDQAAATVTSFEKDARRDLHAFYRDSMPSLTKVNETRREVKAAREKLLAALK